jgi:hypothetical protein
MFPAPAVIGRHCGVRKQYHFWPGEQGLDAWDVDRLITLSKDLVIEHVALDSIADVDSPYWFGNDLEPPTVRRIVEHLRLIEAVDPSYPIILGADGRVMDGMHRIARALLDGETVIAAVRFRDQPDPDYRNCTPDGLPY